MPIRWKNPVVGIVLCVSAIFIPAVVRAASYDSPPALPPPSGVVINVSTEAQLQNAVKGAVAHTTIVIAPGTYTLSSTLYLNGVNDVTLRGATNNRDDVVLVGRGMRNANFGAVPFGIWTNGQRITIANLTVRDVYDHAIILNSGAQSPRVYNVRLKDVGHQFIKANPDGAGSGVNDGIVEYSVIEYSSTSPDDYTNGVDVHTGRKWIVRNTLFRNIVAPPGALAGPAVLIWNGSSGAIIEGNTFLNCQREIAMGLTERTPDDNSGGIVRNNFIARAAGIYGDVGILVADSPGTQVLHNTVVLNGTYPNAIEYRFRGTIGGLIANNLASGAVHGRDGASGTLSSNYVNATASMFVDVAAGNLHLVSSAVAAIDVASVLANATNDWDGEARPTGGSADYGADEFGSSSDPGLPSPWNTGDIGTPSLAGRATYSNGTFTVDGGGTDIWGSSDQFRFVHQQMTGDGQIVARVASLTNTNEWAKAGVMIRDQLTADSPHVFALASPGNGLAFQRRLDKGGPSTHTAGASSAAPFWLKLVRAGSTFSAHQSTDGSTWQLIGTETVAMGPTVFAGLAVTSHAASALATASMTNVSVAKTAGNTAPTVSLDSPRNGSTYISPASLALTATAADPDGSVARVEFYRGPTLIGSDASHPYSFAWTNVAAGAFNITAVAIDDAGARATSSPASVSVTDQQTSDRSVVFTPSADHDSNVTAYTLEVFAAGADPASAQPAAFRNLGKPEVVGGTIAVNISSTVAVLAPGLYFGSVKAVGPGGSTRGESSNDFAR